MVEADKTDCDVFISYRRSSGDRTARLVRSELERLGISTFLDVEDLGSYHFDDRILKSIDEARDFILVLSPDSLDDCRKKDDWLRKEIAYAIKKNKNIVPILEPNFAFPPKGTLPADIASINRYNCVTYSHEFFEAMIERLQEFLETKPAAILSDAPRSRSVIEKLPATIRLYFRKLLILFLIVILILAFLFLYFFSWNKKVDPPPPITSSTTSSTSSSTTTSSIPEPLMDVTAEFVPSGFMGDIEDINIDSLSSDDPKSEPVSIKINYSAVRSNEQGWAGLYWQYPENNWGDKPEGKDLSNAIKLTFWAKGQSGGERVKFLVGGIKGAYPDSLQPEASSGDVTLTNTWRLYTIDLTNKDLSHVIGGFGSVVTADQNPEGATFYLDDIVFS